MYVDFEITPIPYHIHVGSVFNFVRSEIIMMAYQLTFLFVCCCCFDVFFFQINYINNFNASTINFEGLMDD